MCVVYPHCPAHTASQRVSDECAGGSTSCVRPLPQPGNPPVPHPVGPPPPISERFQETEFGGRGAVNVGLAGVGGRSSPRDHHHHHHHRHQEVLDTKLLSRNVDLERVSGYLAKLMS